MTTNHDVEQSVLCYIDEHADELFDTLLRLLRVRSENRRAEGDEAALAPVVADMYNGLGLETEIYYPDDYITLVPDYLPGRGTDHRPNVGGVWRAAAKDRPDEKVKSVMLAAHMDTMPIGDEALWTVDPLGEIRDGKIYGRGSGDDKCGIASGVFIVKAFQALGLRLLGDVVLSAYCDEEFGGGNGSIASCAKYPCDMYINLDGGNGSREIWTCGVGGQALRAQINARTVQDSAALVVDGLYTVKRHIEAFGARRDEELRAHSFYTEFCKNNTITRIHTFQCGREGIDLSRGVLDFVFYTVSDRESIMRELEDMQRAIKAELDGMGLDFEGFVANSRCFDYVSADESDPAIRALIDCASQVEGHEVRAAGACLSDYFLYYKHGSPRSVTYGVFRDFSLPGGAHQPDEYILARDLVNNAKALALFLMRWLGFEKASD